MRVAGWGEQSDATVIRPTYVVSSPPVSRVASMSQPICRAQKNKSCLTAYESKEHRGLVKHEGWDEVTSVPTSRNLESRIRTNQHASAKRAPTEADALCIRVSSAARRTPTVAWAPGFGRGAWCIVTLGFGC
jgi:hypothetical protein